MPYKILLVFSLFFSSYLVHAQDTVLKPGPESEPQGTNTAVQPSTSSPPTEEVKYQEGVLKVNVKNVKSEKGKVVVLLWDNPAEFAKKGYKAFRRLELPAKDGLMTFVFDKLQKGKKYGVFAFHDEDGSEDLNMNFFGIPTEGYVFGNNAKPGFNAPPFEKASIEIAQNEHVMDLELFY